MGGAAGIGREGNGVYPPSGREKPTLRPAGAPTALDPGRLLLLLRPIPKRSFASGGRGCQAAQTATFLRAAAASNALSQDANAIRLRMASSR